MKLNFNPFNSCYSKNSHKALGYSTENSFFCSHNSSSTSCSIGSSALVAKNHNQVLIRAFHSVPAFNCIDSEAPFTLTQHYLHHQYRGAETSLLSFMLYFSYTKWQKKSESSITSEVIDRLLDFSCSQVAEVEVSGYG